MGSSIWCNEPWTGLDAKGPWGTDFDSYTAAKIAAFRNACSSVPKRAEPRSLWTLPASSPVPVLALVGGADPQDPVTNLSDLKQHFPDSRTVIFPHVGHQFGIGGCARPDPGGLRRPPHDQGPGHNTLLRRGRRAAVRPDRLTRLSRKSRGTELIRREDAERFMEEVGGNDRALASTPESGSGSSRRAERRHSPGSREKTAMSTRPPRRKGMDRSTPSRVKPARSSTRAEATLPTTTRASMRSSPSEKP